MPGLVEAVLAQLPAHTYPLVLAGDPDDLLAEEEVLAALQARGYRLVSEPDPIRLRHRVERLRPFSIEEPVLVITPGPLNELPYDLWQPGHRVALALHTFFPRLAYPVVRQLSPAQRLAASRAPQPDRVLGVRATIDFLLRHVFDADPARLAEPAALVAWLNAYHRRADPMSAKLQSTLVAALQALPAYADWPIDEVLADREAFGAFMTQQWATYLAGLTGRAIGESGGPYLLPFADDEELQDALPALMRTGALTPARVPDMGRLPAWARRAVEVGDGQEVAQRAATLLEALSEELTSTASLHWEGWQRVARLWAELDGLFYSSSAPSLEAQSARRHQLQTVVDAAFAPWLRERYAPLAVRRLPHPHHVHHVPDYLAHHREMGRWQRVALLVLDGLSLADWLVVGGAWRSRHPGWRFREQLLLAQIPTITAISRQALVSGRRPADFADTLYHNRAEARQWAGFWARQGLLAPACAYARLALDREEAPVEMHDPRIQALCLIDHSIDELLHGESLGAVGLQASLRVWLEGYSRRLEALIDCLLRDGFVVSLCSDHGHVEARGMGQPSEGLTVESRSQRARLYSDPYAAQRVQQAFSETLLWANDGLLPDDVRVLMPLGRQAFTTYNDTVITHGGPTLEEVVVPLVTITQG
jgi:hypothetical protein